MGLKEDLEFIFRLSRPRFWLYLGGTYLIGFCAGAPALSSFLTPLFFLHLLFFLTIANIFLYGINDLFDTDTDRFNSKKGSKEIRLHQSHQKLAFAATVASLVLSIAFALLQPTLEGKLAFGAFIFLSAAYSLPPFRFKAVPILDFASNLLYSLPGIIGFIQSSGSLPPTQAIAAAFLWTWAMHLYSAVPDIAPDKKAGVNTTAVFLGKNASLALCAIFWGGFAYLAVSSGYFGLLGLALFAYPLIPLILLINQSASVEKAYWLFPYINAAMGFIGFFLIIAKKGFLNA